MSLELERWLSASYLHQRLSDELAQEPVPCYLVGGTVRDLLLGRASRDVDLAVAHDALGIGRRLANRLGGAFVTLDVDRDVARVVLGRGEHIDLTGFRGCDLAEDLWARDFTVNAMAIGLSSNERGRLFDPTGGSEDLRERRLRMPRPEAMRDDPLRLLRGLRISAMLRYRLDAETWTAAQEAVPHLGEVSSERVRDEWLRILLLPSVATVLEQAHVLGALVTILPCVAWNDTLRPRLETLARFWERNGPLWRILEPDSQALLDDVRRPIAGDRMVWPIVMLAGLCASPTEAPDEGAGAALARLALSRRESQLLIRALESGQGTLLSCQDRPADDLALHRLFRKNGWAAVAAALVSAATALSLCGEQSNRRLERARQVVAAWYRRYDQVVAPPQRVSGSDLMRELGIEAGPKVGRALLAIQEAQVLGLVSDSEQALQYLRQEFYDGGSEQ